jgi:hypothetical protein
MEPVSKDDAKAAKNRPLYKFFQGKFAAKVRYTVPGDYKKIDKDNKPQSWETGMSLSTESYTPLKVTDWSNFRYLDISAYNPGETDQKLYFRFSDSASHLTQTSLVVPANGPSTLELDLKMLSDARLNTKDIRSVTMYLDTVDQTKDPVLIFDNLGIHTATYEDRKKAESEEEQATEEEADWDSEEAEGGKLNIGLVSRPGGITGQADNTSNTAGTAAP